MIKVGDEVLVGTLWFKVKKIHDEYVKTIRAGTLNFKRLYLDLHSPVYEHSIKRVRRKGVEFDVEELSTD